MMFMSSVEAASTAEYEIRIGERINLIRRLHQLHILRIGACIETCAEHWSRAIHLRQVLFNKDQAHMMNKCITGEAAEVLGAGILTPRRMTRLWMASPEHRTVIFNPKYDRMAIDATHETSGYWWVAIEFTYQA